MLFQQDLSLAPGSLTMPTSDDELDHGYGPSHLQLHPGNMSKAEQRRSNKPVMEKRRRARINHCLNELKSLILDAMNKDPARHSKLEKADILEMTVKHLQTIQRQQLSLAVTADPGVVHKFRNGFSECVGEVSRYMGVDAVAGVEAGVRQRLVAHLTSCVQQMAPPPAPSGPPEDVNNNTASARLHTLQLIPSRLPSGELALLLPNSQHLPLFPDNQVSTTSDSPVAVSSSRSSAFTAVTRDRSPPPSPSSTTISDSPSPTLPPEVSSTSQYTPSSLSAIQTPLTVITNSDVLKERSQHFLDTRSQETDFKDPLDFSIKKDSFSQPFSPPTRFKRPYREESIDLHLPLKMPKLSKETQSQMIPQPERRGIFEIQNRIPNSFLEYQSLPGQYAERITEMNIHQQPSTSTSASGSRDMWRPW